MTRVNNFEAASNYRHGCEDGGGDAVKCRELARRRLMIADLELSNAQHPPRPYANYGDMCRKCLDAAIQPDDIKAYSPKNAQLQRPVVGGEYSIRAEYECEHGHRWFTSWGV